jgi:hypothetical protein
MNSARNQVGQYPSIGLDNSDWGQPFMTKPHNVSTGHRLFHSPDWDVKNDEYLWRRTRVDVGIVMRDPNNPKKVLKRPAVDVMALARPDAKKRKINSDPNDLRQLRWKPSGNLATYRCAEATETITKLGMKNDLNMKQRATLINQSWYTKLCANRKYYQFMVEGGAHDCDERVSQAYAAPARLPRLGWLAGL